MNNYLYIIVCSLLLVSCKKKTTNSEEMDVGKAYYPTTIGKYVVYDVDSTVYDELTHLPTLYKYRIKEKIEEEFTDNENKTAYKLARYMKKFNAAKPYDSIPWTIKDVWQVNITNSAVEVVEENVRFVKLIFPVKIASKWNGNAKNTNSDWEYEYTAADVTETVNSVLFDKVLTVTQKNFRSLISWQYYLEKYAKGTGLVYREIIDIKNSYAPLNAIFDSIPNKQGIYYKLKIINYGNE